MNEIEIAKAKRIIKTAESSIEDMKKIISELEDRPPAIPPQWEPKIGDYMLYGDGNAVVSLDNRRRDYQLFGTTFSNNILANKASEQFRIYHWMYQAWLEVMGDERVDWNGPDEKFEVIYNYTTKQTFISSMIHHQAAHGFYFNTTAQCEQWVKMVGRLIPKLGV